MDAISDIIIRATEQLLARASGPFHARLIIQPVVATILAFLAGRRDAQEGNPAFFWTLLTSERERRILVQSGWKDISKLFIMAMILDAVYSVFVLRAYFIVQSLIVAIAVAVIPYTLLRGVFTRLIRLFTQPDTPPLPIAK